jgi:hypothetical protein
MSYKRRKRAQRRHRLAHAAASQRAFSVEIQWSGYPTVYKVVHAKTETGARQAAMYAGMRASAETHRGRPDKVIIHADAGTKAEHFNRLRGDQ